MDSVVLLLMSNMLSISVSDLDCKHFVTLDRLYIPIDVCAQHRYLDTDTNTSHKGSHMYQCDRNRVVMYYWDDSTQCDGEEEYSSNQFHTQHMQCTGNTCDYVIVRKYQRTHPEEDMCRREDEYYFIDFSFVTECWNMGGETKQQYQSRYLVYILIP